MLCYIAILTLSLFYLLAIVSSVVIANKMYETSLNQCFLRHIHFKI